MIYILKYEFPRVSLKVHLQIKKLIEGYFKNYQCHIMRTTFLIKSEYTVRTIQVIFNLICESCGVDIVEFEYFISPLINNRVRMKYNLDERSEKWIQANLDYKLIIYLRPNVIGIKKKIDGLLKKKFKI